MKRVGSKISSYIKIAVLAMIMVSGVFIVLAQPTRAVDMPAYRLQISPSQTDLGELEPGQSYSRNFKVQNTGSESLDYQVTIAPYSVYGQEYNQDFTNPNSFTEITDWITVTTTEGTVPAGESVNVEYIIEVPANAPAGNQNAAVIVAMVNENATADDTGIQTIKQIAHPLYANITGNTIKTAEIIENKLSSFLFEPPVVATSVVKNTGNIYTLASYTLEVRNLFGDKVVYTNNEQPDTMIIFPETERYNEVVWENAPQLGIFKVKQTITIFDEENTVEKLVFLCPIWFLCVIIAFIAILIFMIVSRILKRRA